MAVAPEVTLADGLAVIVCRLADPHVGGRLGRLGQALLPRQILALGGRVRPAAVVQARVDRGQVLGVLARLVRQVVVPRQGRDVLGRARVVLDLERRRGVFGRGAAHGLEVWAGGRWEGRVGSLGWVEMRLVLVGGAW